MPTANEKQLVALERVLQTLREEENADVLIETTLNYLQTEFEYNLIWIGLYDRLDHKLFGKGGVTPTGDTTSLKTKFFLNPGDLLEQVVIQQRPVGVPDLRQEVRAGEWRRLAQQFGIQGTLLFPLRCKDRCYGVALLGSHQWGISPNAAEKARLSLVFGELALALYQIEVDWQRSSTKRPDQALFQVLDQITKLGTMQERLEAVVTTTQEFVAPTRTNLYWFEPQGRYFWLRLGNQQKARAIANPTSGPSGLLVQEVNEFYMALAAGRTVAIGAGRSPLKAEVTGLLMKRLRARSLLAAPIIVLKELVGFLAVEGNEPRIWEDAERNYVRAAANLVAMTAQSELATKAQEQSVANTKLVAQVASAVANNSDSQAMLQQCATLLLERLGVERFLLLKEDTGIGGRNSQTDIADIPTNPPLQIVYQHVSLPNRRAISTPLPALSPEDAQVLFANSELCSVGSDSVRYIAPNAREETEKGKVQSNEVASVCSSVVAIEDWEEDERLLAWRSALMQVGVRSLLVCRTGNPQSAGLLVLCHGTPRTWNRASQELVGIVSQQIALVWQIKSFQTVAQLASFSQQTLQSGLNAFLSFPQDPDAFERAFIAFLAELLACPLAALLRWTPQKPVAQVAVAVVASPSFALPPDLAIHPGQDPLIQEALSADGLLERRIKDLSPATRGWLGSTSTGCLLVMALPPTSFELGVSSVELEEKNTESSSSSTQNSVRAGLIEEATNIAGFRQDQTRLYTQNSRPQSIVLLADQAQRQWPSHLLPVVETLVRQFAMCSHYLRSFDTLERPVIDLQQLNWYKHRCLETFHHAVATSISGLVELLKDEARRRKEGATGSVNPSAPTPALQHNSTPESLRRMRSLQLLHHLENNVATLSPLLAREQWQFNLTLTQIPLANLLKRSLLLLTPLTKAQQLEVTVHIPSTERVYSDQLKLECVVLELLLSAVRSCPSGGRINIWCRQIASQESEVTSLQQPSRLTSSSAGSSLLELLITDKIAPEIMNARSSWMKAQPIHPSLEATSLNLKICQRVVRSWGGDLQFYQFEGSKYYTSRLLLPRLC